MKLITKLFLFLILIEIVIITSLIIDKVNHLKNNELDLNLQKQIFVKDDDLGNSWKTIVENKVFLANETAIVIVDMWDKHWSKGAATRNNILAKKINEVIKVARKKGVLIVHSPSEVTSYYKGTPARQRVENAYQITFPESINQNLTKVFDIFSSSSDTNEENFSIDNVPWTKENSIIEIDQNNDGISEVSGELYNFLKQRDIKNIILTGSHTNICILDVINITKNWDFNIVLARDLTLAFYNPAEKPYVNQTEATILAVEFIEKFWIPTITSEDLIR